MEKNKHIEECENCKKLKEIIKKLEEALEQRQETINSQRRRLRHYIGD